VMAGHRLTGRHAIAHRASTLGLTLTDPELRAVTAEVKRRADAGPLSAEELDELLRAGPPTLTLPYKGGGKTEDRNGHPH
jgi:homocitrate synthase